MNKSELDEIANFLKGVSFFSGVNRVSLLELCKNIKTKFFEKNERIINKGDIGDAMYVILNGKVNVHDKQHSYSTFSTADCFGEYALIDDEPRSASVTAMEDTSVLIIESKYFVELVSTDMGFTKGILSVLIKRHRELDVIQERLAASKQEIESGSAKMSGLINGAMDAIIMFDEKFQIILTNPSANKLLENDDVLQRKVLFFFDDASANLIESLVKSGLDDNTKMFNNYLPEIVKVIGSNETETLNEGTISRYGNDRETFYTLILRNIEERLIAQEKINQLTTHTKYLEEEIEQLTNNHGILAEDISMFNVLKLIEQVANTDATVLINGETGTGKELVARAIHTASNRAKKPLVRINCGAIPANLIESELFGHEKGAFTGATVARKGRFLMADKGTIFLDEIGELPLDLQPKLLRVIQEGEFDPLGSSSTVKVDVRIIAATHRDLLKFSKEGKFREDLFYRLNVFPINVPALKDRGNDVCLIAESMVKSFSEKLNKRVTALTKEHKKLFLEYEWPGNVRELQNLVERALIVSKNGEIDWADIIPSTDKEDLPQSQEKSNRVLTAEELVQMERENILKALRQTNWKISGDKGAAALLKLRPTTLTSKIKALGIVRPI
ncbi:hypothetical protein DKG77_09155 [Flagellimonas aquimarina]|uniref:Uncharacterized protein n=1 Tax=Flagellimonas aquimarina TaxID=2201895 RepID=A0A316KX79_9FLAO|nr:sigma 54-interacting transcriptional regulator [Allomuricauda koreensis]PWL38424.1 hypothetical protein DKG77_09155 [Allomuricauda koreensis]